MGCEVEKEGDWVSMGISPQTKQAFSLCTTFQMFTDPRRFEKYLEQFSTGPRYPTIDLVKRFPDESPKKPQSGRLPTAPEVRHMLKQPYFQLFCKFAAPRDEHGIIRIPTSDRDQWNSTRCLIVEVTIGKWDKISTYYQNIKVDRSVGQSGTDSPELHCEPLLVLSVRDEELPFTYGPDDGPERLLTPA